MAILITFISFAQSKKNQLLENINQLSMIMPILTLQNNNYRDEENKQVLSYLVQLLWIFSGVGCEFQV